MFVALKMENGSAIIILIKTLTSNTKTRINFTLKADIIVNHKAHQAICK